MIGGGLQEEHCDYESLLRRCVPEMSHATCGTVVPALHALLMQTRPPVPVQSTLLHMWGGLQESANFQLHDTLLGKSWNWLVPCISTEHCGAKTVPWRQLLTKFAFNTFGFTYAVCIPAN